MLEAVELHRRGERHNVLTGEGAGGDERGEKDGEHHDAGVKQDVRDVGPQEVEHRHLDRDQKHRVDGFLYRGADSADLEDAVLRDDLHGDVGICAVRKEIEESCQVDEDTEHKVDNPRAAVKNDPSHAKRGVEKKSNVSLTSSVVSPVLLAISSIPSGIVT